MNMEKRIQRTRKPWPRVVGTGAPLHQRSHRDAGDYELQLDVFVKNTITGLTGGGGEGATGVDVDQDGSAEYLALDVLDQDNGLIKLACEKR